MAKKSLKRPDDECCSIAELHRRFYYDNGILRAKIKLGRGSNIRYPGDEVGSICRNGYRHTSASGKIYNVHRIIFAMHNNRWPDDQIDHKNKIRDDNRLENLREATDDENKLNQTMAKNNTSGVTGVYWEAGKWRARINTNHTRIPLGCFKTHLAASYARHAAELKYGYSND